VGGVTHVQTKNVCAAVDQLPQDICPLARWPKRANDLCFPHRPRIEFARRKAKTVFDQARQIPRALEILSILIIRFVRL